MKWVRSLREEQGSSVIELALLLPVLLLLLVGAVDFGRAYYAAIEVSSAAQAGALYGTLAPADGNGMVAAARLDAKDVPGLSATASYGCECSDGGSAVAGCGTTPQCAVNVIDFVEVDTTATYTPIIPYPGIPASIVLSAKARMRAAP